MTHVSISHSPDVSVRRWVQQREIGHTAAAGEWRCHPPTKAVEAFPLAFSWGCEGQQVSLSQPLVSGRGGGKNPYRTSKQVGRCTELVRACTRRRAPRGQPSYRGKPASTPPSRAAPGRGSVRLTPRQGHCTTGQPLDSYGLLQRRRPLRGHVRRRR